MKAKVRAGETGAIRGDGKGTRQFTTTPKPPGLQVTLESGRHYTGGKLARPGSIRGGQGAHAAHGVGTGYNQKTGVSASSPSRTMAPRPPVLTDQARTSAGAQRIIQRPSMPFENPYGPKNVPAPASQTERFSGNNATEGRTRFLQHSSASVHSGTSLSREEMAAIGYEPNDTKGDWSLISGQPTRGNQRQAGQPGTNTNRKTSSRENSRMRQAG